MWQKVIWPVHRPRVIPGHEVVGEVLAVGADTGGGFAPGDRVGCGLVAAHVRTMCLLPARPGESLSVLAVHRLGRRRRLCRIHHRPRCVRTPAARRLFRCRAGPAVVCGHHRISGTVAHRPTGRRAAGHIRLRRQRAPHGSGGPWLRARVHVMTRGERARELALALGRRRRRAAPTCRPSRWTPRSCSPLSGNWCCPQWRRSTAAACWRSRGIHLTDISGLELSTACVPGTRDPVGHRQHPRRRP